MNGNAAIVIKFATLNKKIFIFAPNAVLLFVNSAPNHTFKT